MARATPGCTGADIDALCNDAAILAAKRDADKVTQDDLTEARDRLWMGPQLRSRKKTRQARKLTAWHEAGHTIVGLFCACPKDVHRVTILSRGMSGGMTSYLPKEESMQTKREMLAELDMLQGGRVGEEMLNGSDGLTTGPSSDYQRATSIARQYVKLFGMSELGLAQYSGSDFDSPDTAPSEDTKRKVDAVVERLLQESYTRTQALLQEHQVELERLVSALLEHDTLTGADVERVIRGEPLRKDEDRVGDGKATSWFGGWLSPSAEQEPAPSAAPA